MYEPSGSLHTGTARIWFLNNTTTKLVNVLPLLKELQFKISWHCYKRQEGTGLEIHK
jgi:hypothetical protein